MKVRRGDWISLIEAAYSLAGSNQDWLDNLFDLARPLLDPGMGCTAWTFHCTPTTFRLVDHAKRASVLANAINRAGHAVAPEAWFDLTYRGGHTVGTASELIYPRLPGRAHIFLGLTGGRSKDLFMAGGESGTGLGVAFGVLLREHRKPSAVERKRWPQLAAHLGAGLRLRSAACGICLESAQVEAILDSAGRLHAGDGNTALGPARQKLRDAVRRIERARTNAGRSDADAALDNWEALVDGRWSLVDKFDTDGKRFVVAVRNDPAYRDPRGLTRRERQVAELVGMGRTTKQIAYALGVSDTAISNCLAGAQHKLGLPSRSEFAAFFAQNGLRRKLAEVAVAEEQLLVGAYPLVDERRVANLTAAEREIVVHLVSGSTNGDIARRRGSSERTVANQVQSIFRKLGARSRGELASRLH